MLVIRLARTGKKHQAYFRIVVADSHRAVGSKFVEILGNYDPHAKKINIKKDRLEYYLKNGAQPSNTVAKLLVREKIDLPKWVKITEKKKAPKKEPEIKEAPPKSEEAKPVDQEAATENQEADAPVDEVEPTTTEEVKEETKKEAAPEEVASLDSKSSESKQEPEAEDKNN